MFRRHPYLLAAVAVSACALAVPGAALAAGSGKGHGHHSGNKSGCVSAICVYVEQIQTPGGSHPAAGPGGTGPTSGGPTAKPAHLSSHVKNALAHYRGGDRDALEALAREPAFGFFHGPKAPAGSELVSSPGVLGAALDIGLGPTLLFVLLLAAALVAAGRQVLTARAPLRQ